MADQELKEAALRIGGKYNWKNQPQRLVYMGMCEPRNGRWHQFALIESPTVCWCEVLPNELNCLEETRTRAEPASVPTVQAGEREELIVLCRNQIDANLNKQTTIMWTQQDTPRRFLAAISAAPSQPVAVPSDEQIDEAIRLCTRCEPDDDLRSLAVCLFTTANAGKDADKAGVSHEQ